LAITKRFPSREEIAAVYGVIVLMVYSWTIIWFFWKFPSWLNYLSIWEIFKEFCFSVATNLFESLAVLAIPVLLAVILPQKWFRKEFTARAVAMVVIGLGYMIYLASLFQGKEDYPSDTIKFAPWVILAIVLAIFLIGRMDFPRKMINGFAGRSVVFLYLSLPISLICLVIVLVLLVL
jgi:hypothetical protein